MMKTKIYELVTYASAGKLLYGTDWPLTSMADYLKFARGLYIKQKHQDAVFYKNAARLFKLNI